MVRAHTLVSGSWTAVFRFARASKTKGPALERCAGPLHGLSETGTASDIPLECSSEIDLAQH
jgi:hypothetical protein